MKKIGLSIIIAAVVSTSVYATDLMDIYKQAVENDPTFKQAYSTYMSNKEALPQAMSALMPQLSAAAQAGRNFQTNSFNPAPISSIFANRNDFNYSQYSFSASQAVFNYQAWKLVSSASAAVKQAQATFNAAAQDLIVRTAQAYFDVLLAKDTLAYSRAKKRANQRQLEQARQRFKVGLDAITSVYEAEAAYDSSVAEVIADRNNLTNQFENLRILTNHTYDNLAPLRGNRVPLIKPEPAKRETWIDTAVKQNYSLIAAKYAAKSARENIKAQAAGNYPTIDVIGSTAQTQNKLPRNVFNIPRRNTTSSLYLSLNFPVFQGGLVPSLTRQANFDFQTSNESMQQIYRSTIVGSHNAYNSIINGISRIKADRQTIVSQTNSLDSTEAQFKVGTRTMVDVVNAQERLFLAQRQLATDQYAYIIAILNLKQLAGTLNVQDIEEINSWLRTKRINAFAPMPIQKPAVKPAPKPVKPKPVKVTTK